MKPQAIIVHHSAGNWGDAEFLDWLHRHRRPPFSMIGYQKVILNGVPSYEDYCRGVYRGPLDGHIQQGRADNQVGAHCPGWNSKSIGICLIGHFDAYEPTTKQWDSLVDACTRLCLRHGFDYQSIFGHGEVRPTRCPGAHLSMDRLRSEVAPRVRRGTP